MALQLLGSDGNPIWGDATAKAMRSQLVDPNGNPIASRSGANLVTQPYGLIMAGVNDGASRLKRLDRYGNDRPGADQIQFYDPVEGTTINTNIWTSSVTTFTQAQVASTGINMNSGSGLAANSTSILTSNKQFTKMIKTPLWYRSRKRVVPQTNSLVEFGFGAPSGVVAQITSGFFWRYTSAGTVIPYIAFNGSDVVNGVDISGSLNSNNYYTWDIVIDDDSALFVCQDSSTGRSISEQTLQIPLGQPRTFGGASHLPVFERVYVTTSAASSAPLFYISDTAVISLDTFTNKPWNHTMATIGRGAEASPTAFSQTATFANSAAAANATLSNTAAGYTTLGGLFSFAAVAGAATDYALFGFTVPAPYSFYCTGVHITAYNTGAAVATTPTLMHWGLMNNSTAVSLATSALRVPLGSQYFPIGAAIGQCADKDIDLQFQTPYRTDAGKFLDVILRMPVGTATASQVIQGSVTINGYFE